MKKWCKKTFDWSRSETPWWWEIYVVAMFAVRGMKWFSLTIWRFNSLLDEMFWLLVAFSCGFRRWCGNWRGAGRAPAPSPPSRAPSPSPRTSTLTPRSGDFTLSKDLQEWIFQCLASPRLEELRRLNYELDVELQREKRERINSEEKVMSPRSRHASQMLANTKKEDR